MDNTSLFQLPPDVKATHNTNFRSDTTLKYIVVTKEKVGLKLNIQKTKIMASCLTTSWQIVGETLETVADFN